MNAKLIQSGRQILAAMFTKCPRSVHSSPEMMRFPFLPSRVEIHVCFIRMGKTSSTDGVPFA